MNCLKKNMNMCSIHARCSRQTRNCLEKNINLCSTSVFVLGVLSAECNSVSGFRF